jgi:hypothetical protein
VQPYIINLYDYVIKTVSLIRGLLTFTQDCQAESKSEAQACVEVRSPHLRSAFFAAAAMVTCPLGGQTFVTFTVDSHVTSSSFANSKRKKIQGLRQGLYVYKHIYIHIYA